MILRVQNSRTGGADPETAEQANWRFPGAGKGGRGLEGTFGGDRNILYPERAAGGYMGVTEKNRKRKKTH